MAQTPTNAKPTEIIRIYRGLHDLRDSTLRPPGTTRSALNTIEATSGDADRRPGRSFDSLDASGAPVLGIFDLVWDDGGISVVSMANGTMSYDAIQYPTSGAGDTSQVTDPSTPGPMPNEPHFLPVFIDNNSNGLPDFTSYMRSLSELYKFLTDNTAHLIWPNRTYSLDVYDRNGNQVDSDVWNKTSILTYKQSGHLFRARAAGGSTAPPTDGTTIPVDFYWADYFVNPSTAQVHLDGILTGSGYRSIRQQYNTIKNSFIKTSPVDGQSTIANFSGADDIAVISAPFGGVTTAIMRAQASLIASKINALAYVGATVTIGDTYVKVGDGLGLCPSSEQQIGILKTAYNARRAFLGLALDATAIPDYPTAAEWQSLLVTFSPDDFFTTPWINTTVHPSGDIDGASTITHWAGTDYNSAISTVTWFTLPFVGGYTQGTTAGMGPVQVNSLDGKFCQLLTSTISVLLTAIQKIEAITVTSSLGLFSPKLTTCMSNAEFPTLSDAESCISGKHPSTPYGIRHFYSLGCTIGLELGFNTTDIGAAGWHNHAFPGGVEGFSATLINSKGKVSCNLGSYPTGNAKLYLKSGQSTFSGLGAGGVSNNPPVASDGNYHDSGQAPVAATNWTSNYFGDVDASSFGGTYALEYGWMITDQVTVLVGSFTI